MNGKYYGRLEVRYHKKEAARLEHIKNKRKRSKTMVKGYKVFNPDWTCKGKQYTCPGTFEEDVNPSVCNVGMHFCKNAADCFRYYDFDPNNHVAEVIAHGTVAEGEDKCATNKLEIVREISWAEVLEIVNTGKACTGRCNSGDWNKTSFSNGCFNTVSPKIYMFNKPTDWTLEHWLNCRARYLLNQIDDCPLEYVWFDSMTDEEKAAHPEAKTTGGYLKERTTADNARKWWAGLSADDRNIIFSLPNFDAAIFKEITGLTLMRNKGVSAMKEYMIVKVQFNVSSKTCTGKLYTFLAYEEYTPGDVVVVDTQNGFQLATVEGTASKIPDGIPTGGLKEIVCKVDFTAWNERRERAKRMNELQCMMNNRVRDLQETALFEILASKDPELKAMLDEYKTLRGC